MSQNKYTKEWEKELNLLIKKDLQRSGFLIARWGEEDHKPRTELEVELRQFIQNLLEEKEEELVEEIPNIIFKSLYNFSFNTKKESLKKWKKYVLEQLSHPKET